MQFVENVFLLIMSIDLTLLLLFLNHTCFPFYLWPT
jgi:hypothetical protein